MLMERSGRRIRRGLEVWWEREWDHCSFYKENNHFVSSVRLEKTLDNSQI
jgi:hypothetical protein